MCEQNIYIYWRRLHVDNILGSRAARLQSSHQTHALRSPLRCELVIGRNLRNLIGIVGGSACSIPEDVASDTSENREDIDEE
jgi:hypothetical protein